MKTKILFLCTGNSCRSQMAEGWARHLHAGSMEAYSAGVIKHGMNQRAVQVMAEAGVDISSQYSKTVAELPTQSFEAVVSLCDAANESCPISPGAAGIRLHRRFDDPPSLAMGLSDEESVLQIYRRVRDEIKAYVQNLPGMLS